MFCCIDVLPFLANTFKCMYRLFSWIIGTSGARPLMRLDHRGICTNSKNECSIRSGLVGSFLDSESTMRVKPRKSIEVVSTIELST